MTDSTNPFATINSTNIPQNLLSYDGKLGRIFTISIKNFFLTIITLGIYSAWATNNMRKYTFGSFSIGSDRLEYSGKGGQLFKGFVIIALLYLVLATALQFATSILFPAEYEEIAHAEEIKAEQDAQKIEGMFGEPTATVNPEILAVTDANGQFNIDGCLTMHSAEKCEDLYGDYLSPSTPTKIIQPEEMIMSLGAYAIQAANGLLILFAYITFRIFSKFSSSRYRLTCARWRGIRGGIKGVGVRGYILLRYKRLFLNIISLGYLIGRGDLLAEKYILNNAYIGSTKFNFEPDIKALDKVNLITLLLAIPTLGFSRVWYQAAFLNYRYKNLSIAGIKFESSFSGGKMLWLTISNLLIVVFTLLIGKPIATQRSLKFFAANMRVMGNTDNLNFIQEQFKSGTLGEGVEHETDIDSGMDFGVI